MLAKMNMWHCSNLGVFGFSIWSYTYCSVLMTGKWHQSTVSTKSNLWWPWPGMASGGGGVSAWTVCKLLKVFMNAFYSPLICHPLSVCLIGPHSLVTSPAKRPISEIVASEQAAIECSEWAMAAHCFSSLCRAREPLTLFEKHFTISKRL